MTAGGSPTTCAGFASTGSSNEFPHTHRYQVTPFGLKTAIFFTRTHNRLLRTGFAEICDPLPIETPLRREFDRLSYTITDLVEDLGLAA